MMTSPSGFMSIDTEKPRNSPVPMNARVSSSEPKSKAIARCIAPPSRTKVKHRGN